MSAISTDADFWKFQHPVAKLRCGSLVGQVDTSTPQLGLQHISVRSQSIAGSLLSLTSGVAAAWPAALADAYVRGNDLVATYAPTVDWPYAPSVYWRVDSIGSDRNTLAALSLLVSIQTDLLDTHPLVRVTSQFAAEEVLLLGVGESGTSSAVPVRGRQTIRPATSPTAILWRLPGGKLSFVELAEPNDFRQLIVEHTGGVCRSEWELFAEFLEKGVIRRAQIHAAFLPRENDVALATKLCRDLASRPLPLTT
jgi:hypothetical protein